MIGGGGGGGGGGSADERVVLMGLHTCGNLGGDVLRLFAACDAVRAVVAVGCCYHKLTVPRSESDGDDGGEDDDDDQAAARDPVAVPRACPATAGPPAFPMSRAGGALRLCRQSLILANFSAGDRIAAGLARSLARSLSPSLLLSSFPSVPPSVSSRPLPFAHVPYTRTCPPHAPTGPCHIVSQGPPCASSASARAFFARP
jgi:hypothetical protein